MYVVTPIELLAVQVRDIHEHCMWLMEQKRYDEAIELVNQGSLGIPTLPYLVCIKSVVPQLSAGNFEEASSRVCRIRGLNEAAWEEVIRLFEQFGALEHLAVHIPMPQQGIHLPSQVYDMVLSRLLDVPSALRTVLHWWPPEVFSAQLLAEKLKEKLQVVLPALETSLDAAEALTQDERCSVEALARLRAAQGFPLEAAHILVCLGSGDVFSLLQEEWQQPIPPHASPLELEPRRQLLRFIQENLQALFRVDPLDAAALAVAVYTVSPADDTGIQMDVVMNVLEDGSSRWKHEYLKQLFGKQEVVSKDYHMLM
eukprot:1259602-Amphidinium_carterae.1